MYHYHTPEARHRLISCIPIALRMGSKLHSWDSPHRGIVHVMGPEMGATQPGMTIVCGDSHTATHGAFGALAFGIGTTEVGHVMATQCLLQARPKTLGIRIEGELNPAVTPRMSSCMSSAPSVSMAAPARYRIFRLNSPGHGHGKPHDPVQYVHRVRRQGRNGCTG